MLFNESFEVLHIRIPRLTLSARVLSPSSMKIGFLHAKSGLAFVFSEFLCATAKTLQEITSADLRPVELAVTELLISCLGEEKAAFGLGGVAGAKASHLHSICQAVETELSDPDLNLKTVAVGHGVSTRYLQKLFTTAGTTFSHYLRNRRLERSKADLVSPLHNQLSISEICFRWGFNGSAHLPVINLRGGPSVNCCWLRASCTTARKACLAGAGNFPASCVSCVPVYLLPYSKFGPPAHPAFLGMKPSFLR